jgi:hypothetical protein
VSELTDKALFKQVAEVYGEGLVSELDKALFKQVAEALEVSTLEVVKRLFVENPQSEFIAKALMQDAREHCIHGRDVCYLRCGVRKVSPIEHSPVWEPIPRHERDAWLQTF